MNSSSSSHQGGAAAPCGCGGTALAAPCSCAGAGCAACQAQGFVRPRFFAGQLLTEEDLQALSDYVVNKNRLHNRHFLGDGVVCGLAVACNPCGGGKLVVQAGHALDCCGNDLVLECAVELDANAMVRDLRRNQLGADCGDPCTDKKPKDDKGPKVAPRRYCLYLHYSEQSTDPVAPYATDEPCGSSGCEPTRVREGVRFELRCAGDAPAADSFPRRLLTCLSDLSRMSDLTRALAAMFEDGATGETVGVARNALLDRLDGSTLLADCRLRADVAAIAIPPAGSDIDQARKLVVRGFLRMLRDCLCAAILPPCLPCDDSGVLLACIEMADCQVTSICNFERKFVLTGPNLRYWIPLDLLGDLFEALCCADLAAPEPTPAPAQPGAETVAAPAEAATPAPGAAPGALEPAGEKFDTDALLEMASDHVLKSFGLDRSDATQLGHMAKDMRVIFKAGAFDDVLPPRVQRAIGGGRNAFAPPRQAAPGSTDLAARLEEARQQLRADQEQSSQSMARENQKLHAQLETLMARVSKLEGGTPPAPDNAVKKTRK